MSIVGAVVVSQVNAFQKSHPDPRKPDGWWHAISSVTGDLTGGIQACPIRFPAAWLGGHVISLEILNLRCSVANVLAIDILTPPGTILGYLEYVPTSIVVNLSGNSEYVNTYGSPNKPRYLWDGEPPDPLALASSGPVSVLSVVMANVNAALLYIVATGYWWDVKSTPVLTKTLP